MATARDPSGTRPVVIDEVQRLPELLNEVHRLIEARGTRFLLTGSSARALRRSGVNLLAGRAWTAELQPLIAQEIPGFQLDRYLRWGGLPAVVRSAQPDEDLAAYVDTYLTHEVLAEARLRKVPQFHRFLVQAALAHGELINFAAVASDTGVPASTVREHYTVLDDTLLGTALPPWTKSKKRKAIATAKFCLFDLGVWHTICGTRTLDRNSDLYGRAFETFLLHEVRAYLSLRRIRETLSFWRSVNGQEVDLIVGDTLAVEAKATRRIGRSDLKGLIALGEEGLVPHRVLVSQDANETVRDGVLCLPWDVFLRRLWSGEWFGDPQPRSEPARPRALHREPR